MTMERSKEELERLARDVIALNTPDRPDANSHCLAPSGSGITANQEALAKDIARSLNEMSILRHGMFTPVDFEAIVANRIRSFFHSQNKPISKTHVI